MKFRSKESIIDGDEGMSNSYLKTHSRNHGYHKAGRAMWIFLSIFLTIILLPVFVLLILSPGKPAPFLDENGRPLAGSISEKSFITINGVKQGMFIKSKNAFNPVLLYLHGGTPDYFLSQKYPTGLEDYFTVVWWEQRGSGMSYSTEVSRESMNMDQLISDTLELTNYLRNRFRVEKIYLMGHSGGTFIGIQAAKLNPELYYAYIGEAQMVYQLKSEVLAYDYMLQQFKSNGNKKMVNKLEECPVSMEGGIPPKYLAIRDEAMHNLGIGTMHEMNSVITGLFLPSLVTRDYTLAEKYNLWLGKSKSGVSIVWEDMVKTDINKEITKLEIPVYFLEGIYDYTCNYSLARDYFETLQVPLKGFYKFEQSAHSPMFEEPIKMQKIIKEDILNGKNSLADIK